MNSKKAIYFIKMIKDATNGHEKDLHNLLINIINESDSVIELKHNLENCIFLKEAGKELLNKGKFLYEQILKTPKNALALIDEIDMYNATIKREILVYDNLMRSYNPFNYTLKVTKKSNRLPYLLALKQIASTCVYMLLVYGGENNIKNLNWVENDGIIESANSVNTKFLPLLAKLEKPTSCWVITKNYIGANSVFSEYVYNIKFMDVNYINKLCNILNPVQLTPHIFYNNNSIKSNQVPYCWGIGNITSATPTNAISLLNSEIVTSQRNITNEDLLYSMPDPIKCLSILTDNKPFCVSAFSLLNALNEWQTSLSIVKRKKNKICLLCGKKLTGSKPICSYHF